MVYVGTYKFKLKFVKPLSSMLTIGFQVSDFFYMTWIVLYKILQEAGTNLGNSYAESQKPDHLPRHVLTGMTWIKTS